MALPMSGPATTAMPKTPERAPDHPRAGLRGEDDGDDGDADREEAAAAEPLDGAEDDELGEVLAEPREDRADHEDDEAAEEDVAPAPEVRELGEDRDARGGSDDVRADHEGAAVRLPNWSRIVGSAVSATKLSSAPIRRARRIPTVISSSDLGVIGAGEAPAAGLSAEEIVLSAMVFTAICTYRLARGERPGPLLTAPL